MSEEPAGAARPAGDVYDWYQRGMSLLRTGHPAAAAALLEHAVVAEPGSRSVRELLARAQYAAGSYERARDNFEAIISDAPADDYAHFGLGLTLMRTNDLSGATEHLALAAAMRPDNRDYGLALRRARAVRAAAS